MDRRIRSRAYARPRTHGPSVALLAALLLIGLPSCAPPDSDAPDLIFTGGIVYPLGATDASVSALAVRGSEIVATGTDAEVRALAGPRTQQMELEGQTLLPGFRDRWADPEALGRWVDHPLDLRLASTREEVQAILRNAAAARADDAWLVGWGWEESNWPDPSFPTRGTLDTAVESPVILYRRTGRVAWLSTAALRAAGIDADTPEPEGGRILRDADGSPTGILVGTALTLVEEALPPADEARRRDWIASGLQEMAAAGFTSVTTPPVDAATAGLYAELGRRDRLAVRVDLRLAPGAAAAGLPDHELLRPVAVGTDLDGPFGPRLAALSAPYADSPDARGLLAADRAALRDASDASDASGLELHVQARGDRAVALALDVMGPGDLLVGMDLPPEGAIASLPEAGVEVAFAPGRFAHEVYWLAARLGTARAARAHPWRAVVAADVPWGMASLAPSYPLHPMGMVLATTRRTDVDGYPSGGFHPEHAVGRSFALRALAASPVDGPGLADGSAADLVVWSENPMQADDDGLLRAQALVTVVAGRVAFSRALVDLPMGGGR